MATGGTNYYKTLLFKKVLDFINDTFKICLMEPTFIFIPATHQTYADISADELTTAYGYTEGGETLSGVAVSQDDTNNRATAIWTNQVWTIAGGTISAGGAIIYDDTVTSPVDKPIIGFIDFNGAITTYSGGTMTVANPSAVIQ
jgi:hypothetical protein